MRRIRVTPNRFALVDDRLYKRIKNFGSWGLTGRGYASCYVRGTGRRGRRIYMHHLVYQLRGEPVPQRVDHENRRKLDNRYRNLRASDNSQNNANRPRQSNNKSGYRGVSQVQRATTPKWKAEIKCKRLNKRYNLGCFNSPEAAARAYDKAAIKYFGEFAFLNFPRVETV